MAKQDILKIWQKTAKMWQKVKPTYRPSKIEIELFEKFLKKVLKEMGRKDFKVLVLGATPEVRDLLAKYRLDATLLDANKIMFKAMSQLIKKKNPRERFVRGNWLKMPLKNSSFDLVISDHPTSSIEYKNADKFFSEIQRILKPQGFFIIDIHINAELPPLTTDEYIETYRKDPSKWSSNFDNHVLAQYRTIMGYENYYNPKTFRSQWGKLDKMLRLRYKSGKLTKKEYNNLICGLGENYIFNFYTKKAAEKVIKKYFKILNYQHIKAHPVYKYYWPCFAKSLKR